MIVVDARKIADGGIGTYLQNLFKALDNYSGDVGAVLPNDAQLRDHQVRGLVEDLKSKFPFLVTDIAPNSVSELLRLGAQIKKKFPIKIFHSPHFTLPYGLEVGSVITLHDITLTKFPRSFLKGLAARLLIKSAMRRASCVVTCTEASKDEIISEFGFEDKLQVVPHALPPYLLNHDCRGATVRNRVLVVGTDRSHKRLVDSFNAWKLCFEKDPEKCSKFCFSVVSPHLTSESQSMFDSLPGRTELLSEISDTRLVEVYSESAALLVSSVSEGFHFPSLEASAMGVPVVGYDIPPLRERECLRLCEAFNVELLANELAKVLFTDCISQKDLDKSACLAKEQFSLQNLQEKLFALYELVER